MLKKVILSRKRFDAFKEDKLLSCKVQISNEIAQALLGVPVYVYTQLGPDDGFAVMQSGSIYRI